MILGRKKYSLDECHLGRSAANLISETELNFEEAPTLYMFELSPPSRAAVLTATALGVPLQFITVNVLLGEQMDPEYVKKNPQHLIPLLKERDFILGDSHAIAGYLVTAYGRTDDLYPKDPRRRAIVDQRLHFDSSTLFVNLRALITPLMMKQETSISESSRQKVDESLGILEKYLEKQKWLAGPGLTIADLCCVATVSSLHELIPVTPERFPSVYDWLENCKTLPYYEEANGVGARKFGETIRSLIVEK